MIVFVSDDCNYNCSFCYNIKPRTKLFINLDVVYDSIIYIYKVTNKNIFLEILGGEPTLHPQLLDFCKKLYFLKFVKYFVFTNFSQNIKYYQTILELNGALSITWHSKHDDLSNMSFINKVKLINKKYFDNPGIRLRILYEIFNTDNALKTFNNLFIDYSNYIEFDLLADINSKKFNYSNEQLNQFNKCISQLSKPTKNDYIVTYSNNTIKYFKFTDLIKNQDINFKYWKCNAGKDCMYIHVDGNIYPCESYYFATSANVFNGIISNMYNNIKILKNGVICKCEQCAWSWNIYKENIFKNINKLNI